MSYTHEKKPSVPTISSPSDPFDIYDQHLNMTRPLDLDGMTLITDAQAESVPVPDLDTDLGMPLDLAPVEEPAKEDDVEELSWGNDPATAAWAPMMAEVSWALHPHKPS